MTDRAPYLHMEALGLQVNHKTVTPEWAVQFIGMKLDFSPKIS